MATGSTLKHLQALQAMRPLEPPGAMLGAATIGEPKELFGSAVVEDVIRDGDSLYQQSSEELREVVRKAEFWISLLEGEQSDLHEEIAKHKKRHQLTIRQSEAKASALREAEVERRRLLTELKWLQESRDKAICERHMLREDSVRMTSRRQEDVQSLAARTEVLEHELKRERDEKAELEKQLVRTKVRFAESLQSQDTLEAILDYYEGQLKLLSPGFEPQDRDSLGVWLRPTRQSCDSSEVESLASGTTSDQQTVTDEKLKGGRHFMKLMGSKVKNMLKTGGSRKKALQPASESRETHQMPMPEVEELKSPRVAAAEVLATPRSGSPGEGNFESPKRQPRRWELRQE